MARRPQVDPAILLHRYPRAWEELLGWGCIEAFLGGGAKFVDVDSLDALVDYSVSSPSAMRLVLAGVEFAGRRGREWEDYLRGRLEMGARMKFPKVETGVRRDDVWIQISPAYMLLPFDETKRTWQKMAHAPHDSAGQKPSCVKRRGDKETANSRGLRPKPPEKAREQATRPRRRRPLQARRRPLRRGGCFSRGVS
jgi:hypothetical protein